MYWYLEAERPIHKATKFKEYNRTHKLDQETIAKFSADYNKWTSARGKFLFAPNMKLFKWYLMPHGIKASSAGNRAGKTSGICMDVIMQIEGWHPLQKQNLERLCEEAIDVYKDFHGKEPDVSWVKKHRPRVYQEQKWIPSPPIFARCVAPDYSNYVEKVIGPEYEKWATKSLLSEVAYENQNKRIIKWKDSSFIEFLTSE